MRSSNEHARGRSGHSFSSPPGGSAIRLPCPPPALSAVILMLNLAHPADHNKTTSLRSTTLHYESRQNIRVCRGNYCVPASANRITLLNLFGQLEDHLGVGVVAATTWPIQSTTASSISCQRRLDSRPAWRRKSRPVMGWAGRYAKGPDRAPLHIVAAFRIRLG